MARLEISLSDDDKNRIVDYCKEKDLKISALLRIGAKKVIENEP